MMFSVFNSPQGGLYELLHDFRQGFALERFSAIIFSHPPLVHQLYLCTYTYLSLTGKIYL